MPDGNSKLTDRRNDDNDDGKNGGNSVKEFFKGLTLIGVLSFAACGILESAVFNFIFAVLQKTIAIFKTTFIPIFFGLVDVDVTGSQLLAFLAAVTLTIIPIVVFKYCFSSGLFSSVSAFHETRQNFIVSVSLLLVLLAVFGVEMWNFTSATKMELRFVACDVNANPLCPSLKAQAEEKTRIEEQLQNAFWHAMFISILNFVVGWLSAYTITRAFDRNR